MGLLHGRLSYPQTFYWILEASFFIAFLRLLVIIKALINHTKPMHPQEFVQRMKERLLEEKDRLNEELSQFSHHTEVGDREDENASEIEMDEVNEDIAETLRADLKKVETALSKIDAGTYGLTADGEEIPESRLEVIPWADTLVD